MTDIPYWSDWDDPCDVLKEEECLRDEPVYNEEPPFMDDEQEPL